MLAKLLIASLLRLPNHQSLRPKLGPVNKGEQQGCFAINSNIEAEKPRMAVSAVAEIVLSFFSGLCIERNLKSRKSSWTRKIENFMAVLRNL
jgi:hypothetical protein